MTCSIKIFNVILYNILFASGMIIAVVFVMLILMTPLINILVYL